MAKLNMRLYTMHMVTILPIPILRITIVRKPQLSAGFAGKSRNRGTLSHSPRPEQEKNVEHNGNCPSCSRKCNSLFTL